ncbi:Hypothetical predicted protein [Mytilus galloprovincialis]|uniref:Uncharacterized protein n=1 Tax=Mytilus galloprovincialis TaxID=29158 RepID=A0A8B6H687_MYTGA|nr:Hypothetical predicted protein [Mytilus galloprovincialis]
MDAHNLIKIMKNNFLHPQNAQLWISITMKVMGYHNIVELWLAMNSQTVLPQSKYIQELRERLVKAYELASKAADRAREKQKTGYDLKARGATLEIGDKVLVKVVAYDGKHKIADRWEDDVYVIIGQPNSDVPVYTVQKENGEGRRRTLHRNLLLPVGNINQRKPEPPPKPVPPPRTRLRQRIEQPSPEPSEYESSDEELDVLVRLDYDIPPYHMEPILQDMDTPVQNDTELDGDAHSTATGASRDSDDQSTEGSASGDEQAEIVTQPEPVVIPLPPIPVPRRSTRTRLEPEWMRSGKFVHKVAVPVQQQWEQKAKFISDCLRHGLFPGLERQAGEALLAVITND